MWNIYIVIIFGNVKFKKYNSYYFDNYTKVTINNLHLLLIK